MAEKNPKDLERRELVERMRQDQARKERARNLAILGACVLVVVGLIGAAGFKAWQDNRESNRLEGLALEKIGPTATAAACDKVFTEAPLGTDRSGATGNHVEQGIAISYPSSPPAFGQHWPNFLTGAELRPFYSPQDRPELQRLVHSLEHGHTFIWYDDTIKQGSKTYQDLEAIAAKYDGTTTYVHVTPWNATDGSAFPDGKHVALTHWAGQDDDQKGVWQYCGEPSGEAIKDFVTSYPNTDSPEAGAP